MEKIKSPKALKKVAKPIIKVAKSIPALFSWKKPKENSVNLNPSDYKGLVDTEDNASNSASSSLKNEPAHPKSNNNIDSDDTPKESILGASSAGRKKTGPLPCHSEIMVEPEENRGSPWNDKSRSSMEEKSNLENPTPKPRYRFCCC
jgi:hypothetical protein